MAPTVSTCCGCIELRTGVLILGWLDVISSALGILGGIQSLITGVPEDVVNEMANFQDVSRSEVQAMGTGIALLQIVFSAIYLFLSAWFLRGVYDVSQSTFIGYGK